MGWMPSQPFNLQKYKVAGGRAPEEALHKYNTILKILLLHARNSTIEKFIGATIGRWHNVELPKVEQIRVDLRTL